MSLLEDIKKLREETGLSVMEIKKALQDCKGDFEKAKELLKIRGCEFADKKMDRTTKAGMIDCYIHSNLKTGVLLDIRCESDFVAQSPDFKKLAHEICLQIAAMKPLFLKEEDIPPEFLDGETKIFKDQLKDSGKPPKIIDQIIEGKLKKYKQEICLLSQPWIKEPTKTIEDLIKTTMAKLGEKIEIKRFARFEI